jgi:hypothetical protein
LSLSSTILQSNSHRLAQLFFHLLTYLRNAMEGLSFG